MVGAAPAAQPRQSRGRRRSRRISRGICHDEAVTVSVEALAAIGRAAGLCAVGVCRADPFTDVAAVLHERKQAGLHAGMQFTFRNPERSTDPTRRLPGAVSLVVGALEFDADSAGPPDDGAPWARVAAYARSDHYASLRTALESMAGPLRAEGHRAVVAADENCLVDRAAAHRAAIGWWGKNSNILVPGVGSLVVLGAVVTDAPLSQSDPTPAPDACGACRQCLDGCPTGAIIAPGTVDARRCLAWLVQQDGVFDPDYRVALGDRVYGCDDCSEVCPPNRARVRLVRRRRSARAITQPVPGAAPQDGPGAPPDSIQPQPSPPVPGPAAHDGPGAWASVLDMLDASDDELMRRYGRWYIPRRQPRYLRRNALVVLGNVGDKDDPRVGAAVERALADPDPLVRAHAVWCARRLGLGVEALRDGDDPLVKAELGRNVPVRAP